jgi:hypothetical protein
MLKRAVESLDRSTLLGVVVNSCSSRENNYYYSRYAQDAVKSETSSSPSGT